MSKNPLPLDTASFLSDPDLRGCSPNDRGILIDLMCMAHNGQPYGYITNGGVAVSERNIAGMVRISSEEWTSAKKRLLEARRIGVTDQTGCIFIPRMVKDGQVLTMATEGGKKGGNPNLTLDLGDDKETPERAKPVTVSMMWNKFPAHLQTPEMRDAVNEWFEYRQRRKLVLTRQALTREVNILMQYSPEEAIRWIHCAIDRGWRGFYPPPAGYGVKHALPNFNQKPDDRSKKEFTGHAKPSFI